MFERDHHALLLLLPYSLSLHSIPLRLYRFSFTHTFISHAPQILTLTLALSNSHFFFLRFGYLTTTFPTTHYSLIFFLYPPLSILSQAPKMPFKVSALDVRNFQECGVVVLRNVLTPEQVETLKSGIDRGYANPSPRSKIASHDSDRGKFFEDFRCWQEIPEYKEIIFKTDLPRIAAELTGSRTIRLHHDHMLIKEPKTQQRTPWHQDTPYYNVEGNQTVSFWMPVDKVPEDSAMEFILGSHKWPWMMPRTFKDNVAKWFPEGSLPELPDIEGRRSEFPIVSYELNPGDCYAFNFNMMHAAKGSTVMRRAMSVRYVGDDVVYAPRQWVTSPYFPELEKDVEGMKAGGPLVHSLFPVVYASEAQL